MTQMEPDATYETLNFNGDTYLVYCKTKGSEEDDQVAAQNFRVGRMHFIDHPINEAITGDFWMVLKPHFEAERTYVPFKNGLIISDRSQWVIEPIRSQHTRQRSRLKQLGTYPFRLLRVFELFKQNSKAIFG